MRVFWHHHGKFFKNRGSSNCSYKLKCPYSIVVSPQYLCPVKNIQKMVFETLANLINDFACNSSFVKTRPFKKSVSINKALLAYYSNLTNRKWCCFMGMSGRQLYSLFLITNDSMFSFIRKWRESKLKLLLEFLITGIVQFRHGPSET